MENVRIYAVDRSHHLSCACLYAAQDLDATAVIYPLDHFVCLEDRFVKTLRQAGLIADLLKDRADLLGAALDNSDVAYGRIQPMGCAERYIAGAENLPNDTGKTGHGIPHDLRGEIHDDARIDLRGELYRVGSFEGRVRS